MPCHTYIIRQYVSQCKRLAMTTQEGTTQSHVDSASWSCEYSSRSVGRCRCAVRVMQTSKAVLPGDT